MDAQTRLNNALAKVDIVNLNTAITKHSYILGYENIFSHFMKIRP